MTTFCPELIPMETPLGFGYALFVDSGEMDNFWTVILDTGALVTFPQNKLRVSRSYTHGRIPDAEMRGIVA